jgi:hypothetical protein
LISNFIVQSIAAVQQAIQFSEALSSAADPTRPLKRATQPMTSENWQDIAKQAYAASDAGNLKEAAALFGDLLRGFPEEASFHYMQGLVHKYLRDWPVSLHHNLRSQALREEPDEASQWNAGIAATAVGDWTDARRMWKRCGMKLPDGEGAIDANFGVTSIRLNPWGDGETLYAQRIDPVRARLLNVPLPESGYRFGDIVLHDGAATGSRRWEGRDVFVFNALERLQRSDFETVSVFVTCEDPVELESLLQTEAAGIGGIEDWTGSVSAICRRCSYGVPHQHGALAEDGSWQSARNIGFAAQGRRVVETLLDRWKGGGRSIDGIESRESSPSAPDDGFVWWLSPDDLIGSG